MESHRARFRDLRGGDAKPIGCARYAEAIADAVVDDLARDRSGDLLHLIGVEVEGTCPERDKRGGQRVSADTSNKEAAMDEQRVVALPGRNTPAPPMRNQPA